MEDIKKEYNYILNRYYNGCNYVEENPEEFDKYISEIMKFKTKLDEILTKIEKHEKVSKKEILEGFKIF